MLNIGYCCINLSLQQQGITYSRDMIKRTFDARGISYASELALANSIDFIKVVQWNVNNNVRVFRMGSGIFPWANHYKLTDLPDYDAIAKNLRIAGDIAMSNNQRITTHPDHFVKLASKRDDVVTNSIAELELHAAVFDMMGLPQSPHAAINIHVGMNFDEDTAARWVDAANRLSTSARSRLVVENDDKPSGFSVVQLVSYLYTELNVPVTFDYFHHTFHTDGLSTRDAFDLAYATWPDGVTPLFHYSESRNVEAGITGNPRAHSDWAINKIDHFDAVVDIDLEVKMKELALFKYKEKYNEG